MSKKNVLPVVIFLLLGLVTTYVASLIEILLSGETLAGAAGFPFRYGNSSFFGGAEVNQAMFLLDIAFWSIILFAIWKVLQFVTKK